MPLLQGTPPERARARGGGPLMGNERERVQEMLTLFGHRFNRAGHGTLDLRRVVAHRRRRRWQVLRLEADLDGVEGLSWLMPPEQKQSTGEGKKRRRGGFPVGRQKAAAAYVRLVRWRGVRLQETSGLVRQRSLCSCLGAQPLSLVYG